MSNQVEEYPLVKIPVENLQFDASNPNKPTKEQIEAIKKSLHRFGYLVPIIVNESYEIGDGEHRALIYKELGIKEIPAYVVPKINDDIERRLLRQTMNKLRGEHEPKLDAQEIALIFKNDKLDNLAELLAQDVQTLEQILTKQMGIQFQHEDDFDVEKTLEELVPDTQLGDMWELDQHRLICADCTDKRSLFRLINDKKIDMIFADPPYHIEPHKPNAYYDTYDPDISDEDYEAFCKLWFESLPADCDRTIITPGPRNAALYPKPKDIGIWFKANSSTYATVFNTRKCEPILFYGDGYKDIKIKKRHDDFFDFTKELGSIKQDQQVRAELHVESFAPLKPVKLISELINYYSESGGIVFDPFMGSGTTLIAAEQTKRICYGVELDPKYCDVIKLRWEKYTGKTAKKIVPLKV